MFGIMGIVELMTGGRVVLRQFSILATIYSSVSDEKASRDQVSILVAQRFSCHPL